MVWNKNSLKDFCVVFFYEKKKLIAHVQRMSYFLDLYHNYQKFKDCADHWCAGVNVLCGIGLLTTPYAVREGGWLSLTILVIFCVLAYYTGILLMRCLESNPGLKTYPDISQATFGRTGRLAIAVSLMFSFIALLRDFYLLFQSIKLILGFWS